MQKTRELTELSFFESEFDKALLQFSSSRSAMEKNWGLYSGFDYSQWPVEAVSNLRRQNRSVTQYNFIRGKIDKLAGYIVKNWMDVDFVPVDGALSPLTNALKGAYYSDKEMMDWDREYLQFVVDGLIHHGIEQMYISDRYSPLGNIGFQRIDPGHVVYDPNWKSNNAWDLRRLWKIAYLTPDQIKDKYDKSSVKIDERLRMMSMVGESYRDDTSSATVNDFNLESLYGNRYRVIELHHLVNVKKKYEFVVDFDDSEIEIPEGTYEEKAEFVQTRAVNPKNVIEKVKTVKEYWVTTGSSQLCDEFLENRKSEIQIGRLPFFPWSSCRINGKDSGLVDLLADVQQTINKRESLLDFMITTSAAGGRVIDPAIVNNDRRKLDELKANFNNPDYVGESAPGAIASGRSYFQSLPQTKENGAIYREIDRMFSYLEDISGVTATLEGRSEIGNDTASLFTRKQAQAEISQTLLFKGLEQHLNDKGEAYMLLAKDLYSGAYREFSTGYGINKTEREVIRVNDVGVTEVGDIEVINDMSKLPRHKVVVNQSSGGVTLRTTNRLINSEMLSRIPPQYAATQALIIRNIIDTLDLSDEDKRMYEKSSQLELELAIERMATEKSTLAAQRTQNEMMMQQAMQPAQQPAQQQAMQQQQSVEDQTNPNEQQVQ